MTDHHLYMAIFFSVIEAGDQLHSNEVSYAWAHLYCSFSDPVTRMDVLSHSSGIVWG